MKKLLKKIQKQWNLMQKQFGFFCYLETVKGRHYKIWHKTHDIMKICRLVDTVRRDPKSAINGSTSAHKAFSTVQSLFSHPCVF